MGKRPRGWQHEDAQISREKIKAYVNKLSPEMYQKYRIPSLKICGEEGKQYFEVRLLYEI
jgi:hypothetical protein